MRAKTSKNILSSPVLRYLFPLVVLGLAVHLLVPQIATFEHSIWVIQQMAWWAVVLAVSAQITSYLCYGYLLQSIVRLYGDDLPIYKGALIFTASMSFGMVAGGLVGIAAATFRWMQKERVKTEAAGLSGTVPLFFISTTLVIFSLAGLIHLLVVHQLTQLQMISFASILFILGAIAGVLVWGFRHRLVLSDLIHRLGAHWARRQGQVYLPDRIDAWLMRLFNAWDLLARGGWHSPAVGALLAALFDMLTLYFIFIAAGNPVSPGTLLTGYGLPLLLGKVAFIVPGGIGVVEGSMVALYDGLGVPDPVTVVVVLAYRIISFWLPLLLGFPLILLLQHLKTGETEQETNL